MFKKVYILYSAFCTQRAFYSQSAVCILHSVCILPLVRSLQSAVCVLHWPVQNTIFCVNYWVWNFTLQTFTWQLYDLVYYITCCMCKLLSVKSHSWFHAKEYFIIKWAVEDSPHWLQVDWIQTDHYFEIALFKPSPLGWLFVLLVHMCVVWHEFCFIQLTS